METEDLTFDDGSQGQVVKELGELFPHIGVPVLPQTLVIETVHLCNLSAFVVSSQNCQSVSVSHLQGYQKGHCLH